MAQRHHVAIVTLVGMATTIGIVLGSQAAVQAADFQSLTAPEIVTQDPMHPIEVFFVPPFISSYAEAVAALGLEVYPEDRLRSRPELSFGLGGQLIIERARLVEVRDGTETRQVRTWATRVGELLAEAEIEIGQADQVNIALDGPLPEGAIVITRVSITEVQKTEPIKYQSRRVEDSNRPRGETAVIQAGKAGTKQLTYRVRRENGRETSRELIRTDTTAEPIEEIIAEGTRVKTLASGKASWYKTPWGGLTAAHNSLPKGTIVDVVDVDTGKRVTVKINDRGIGTDAIIDLSSEAFQQLAPLGKGIVRVRLEIPG